MTGMSRYYELRLYKMLPTRMPVFHDLLGVQVPPLFAKCGVSRPLGFWESYAGPYAPLFGYILPWESLDARMAAWTRFYADPVWQEKLSTNYAGQQRVDRPSVLILRPSAVWPRFHSEGPVAELSGIHEMRIYRGRQFEDDALLAARVGAAQEHGAEVLGVFDGWIGLPTDSRIVFLAWPDDAQRLATRSREATLYPGDFAQSHVMRPLGYGVPMTNFSTAFPERAP
ncbi:MAG: NIPSNAP family protein [Rhizobiaceae bacterium]|nr:NIPSNAP family protein [Rhizobiaceae bacterium]